MYAIPAVFRFVKNIIWKADPEEDQGDVDCEEILQKLVEEENSNIPMGYINPDHYLRGFGKVTQCTLNGGFINKLYFNSQVQKPNIKTNDVVEYLYKKDDNGHVTILRILSVVGDFDVNSFEEDSKAVDKRVMVTKVVGRQDRQVILDDAGLNFNLDNVTIDFVPIIGDWLELCVDVRHGSLQAKDESEVSVTEVRALRSLEVKTSTVTHWDGESAIGTIGDTIFFTSEACKAFTPAIGDQVVVDAIESDQGCLTWRALSVVFISKSKCEKSCRNNFTDKNNGKRNGVVVEGELSFGKMKVGDVKRISVSVSNNSGQRQTLSRVLFAAPNRSQFRLVEGPREGHVIAPNESVTCTFECRPFFVGYVEEVVKFFFKNFYIRKVLKVYVENDLCENVNYKSGSFKTNMGRNNIKKYMETRNRDTVKGVKIARPPAFIHIRIPTNHVPSPLWDILSEYHQVDNPLNNLVEDSLPVLTTELSFSNYQDKFHTLLHLEEIAQVISIRSFDMDKAYLLFEGEFLTLEVPNLAEGRPSLVIGDTVKVKNPYLERSPVFEGCIHDIAGDKLYAKFSSLFHNSYKGEDVSVFFSTSRTSMIHSHYAVDLAVKLLGQEILFPERIYDKKAVLEIERSIDNSYKVTAKNTTMEWFNKELNELQQSAVVNALVNVARPLPYVIFGPPGTGKTVTLVEAILQIWRNVPESRLLVVTPSNSSANLIAERLIDYGNLTPGCLLRLVAFHLLRNNSLSEKLKPYCAGISISEQKESHKIDMGDEGKKIFSKLNIGRHRITVATCVAVGRLYHFGFPRGHFTHIVMDEAGQASEPEGMISLCFMDKKSGQVILAGDPQQLGPVILSNHSQLYGLEESYLGRLIKTFPYQRDVYSYKGKADGYNPKVITKLLYNYRTIPKLLALPSELYYNGSLVSKISLTMDWVQEILDKVGAEVELTKEHEYPGIMFYGIRGINIKGEQSPSWYNPHEASMLALFISKLYENGVSVEDIGVISPYIQQNKFIRSTLVDLELPTPKLGTVEEFQGQEKKIILASTVRSCEMSSINTRIKNVSAQQVMGFLRNPKRLNVLLTRAQVLLVIFGNPHTLSAHDDWKYVIQYSVDRGSYVGCDLPRNFN